MSDAKVIYEFAGYRLDPQRRRLSDPDGHPVALRAKVFNTLCVLVERAGEPVSKTELLSAVWATSVVEENNLNQAISALRQALGDDRHNPTFIATITGRGYQFVENVTRRTAKAALASDARPTPTAQRRRWLVALGAAAGLATLAGVAFLADRPPRSPAAALSIDAARPVTSDSGAYSMPTLSPDGTLMAFVSDRSGMQQVWIKGLPNGKSLQVTDGQLPASWPSWSPVGDNILFQRADAVGTQSVWLVDALGRSQPRIVASNATAPRFAANGRSFVFSRNVTEVHTASLDDGRTHKLDGLPESPGFAPAMPAMNAAGDIAFVLADEGPSGNLWIYEAASRSFRQVGGSRSAFAGEWARSPVWLPDGRTIVYVAADEDPANSHLWQADSVTGQTARISTGVGGYGDPAISGDGLRLVYSYVRPASRLMRTDPATGASRTIYESRNMIALPQLSPDGRTIAFFGEHVHTLGIDGGEPEQRTFGEPGQATIPVWSRSNATIYYYRERSLHRIDPDTGRDELVLEDFHWSSSNWLAVDRHLLAYWSHNRSSTPDRTVIYDTESQEETVLDERVLPAEFTRDGRAMLGVRASDAAILICSVPRFDCNPLTNDGQTVGGANPRWSTDESRVFYHRHLPDKPGYSEIWVVGRTGAAPELVTEIGPFDPMNVYFGIAHDETIIWNSYDRLGNSEVWMIDLDSRTPAAGSETD